MRHVVIKRFTGDEWLTCYLRCVSLQVLLTVLYGCEVAGEEWGQNAFP